MLPMRRHAAKWLRSTAAASAAEIRRHLSSARTRDSTLLMPAKAGIQVFAHSRPPLSRGNRLRLLDSRLRGNERSRAAARFETRASAHGQAAGAPLSRRAMLRRLYKWCIDAADKPHATWLMGIVSLVESSFFPIPPDAMLIPMSLARPDRAWFYATVCTLTSVAGGLLGYFI